MANEKRLIFADDIKEKRTVLWDSALGYSACVLIEDIDEAPTVNAVPLEQHNELKEKYNRLLETADILDAALREYQRKYGDLEGE